MGFREADQNRSVPPEDAAGHLTASIISVNSAENTEPCNSQHIENGSMIQYSAAEARASQATKPAC